MVACKTVRKDNSLFCDINQCHETRIDNKAPAKTDKTASFLTQLIYDNILYLSKLVRYNPLSIVLGDQYGVIPISRYENQPIRGNTNHLRTLVYDKKLFHWVFVLCKYKGFALRNLYICVGMFELDAWCTK